MKEVLFVALLLTESVSAQSIMLMAGSPGSGVGTTAWITLVASPACVGNPSSAVISGVNNTGATFFVLAVSSVAGATAVSDSVNATTGWTRVANTGGPQPQDEMWYHQNPGISSSQTITVAGSYVNACFLSFSGMVTSGVFESAVTGSASNISEFQPGLITPGSGRQLIVTTQSTNNVQNTLPTTIDSGFTAFYQVEVSGVNFGGGIAYLIQSNASPVNPRWNNTNLGAVQWQGINATFKGQ